MWFFRARRDGAGLLNSALLVILISHPLSVFAQQPALDAALDVAIDSVGLDLLQEVFPYDGLEFSCGGGGKISVNIPPYVAAPKSAGSKVGTPAECLAWRTNPNGACQPPPAPATYSATEQSTNQMNAEFECRAAIQNALAGIVVTCEQPPEPQVCKKDTCIPINTRNMDCPKSRPTSENIRGSVSRPAADGSCTLSCTSTQSAEGFTAKVRVGCTECG